MSSGGRISDVIDLEEIGEPDHGIAIALPGGARHCGCLYGGLPLDIGSLRQGHGGERRGSCCCGREMRARLT
jgi:hypothetical protein